MKKTKGTAATGRGTNTVKPCDTSGVPPVKGGGKGSKKSGKYE